MPGEPRALLHVFSTVGAFYLLLGVVFFVYWKIYKAAKLSGPPEDQQRLTHIEPCRWVLRGSLKTLC